MKPPAPVTAARTPSKPSIVANDATYTRPPCVAPSLAPLRLARAARCGPARGGRRARRLDRRAADPPPPPDPGRGDARLAGRRPDGGRGAAPAHPGPRHRPVHAPDVGLRDGPRASLRRPRGASGGGCGSATRSSPTGCSGSARCPTSASSARSAIPGKVTALDRFLSVVHWVWFMEPHRRCCSSRPAIPSASRAPRASWRPPTTSAARSTSRCPTAPPWWAAEQGYIEAPVEHVAAEVAEHDTPHGAADHGRRRRAGLAPRLGAALRVVQQQSLGGDAVASLRHLADGGDPPGRGGAVGPARSAGATRARSPSPSSTSASTTSPTWSPGRRWWRVVRRGEPLAEPAVEAVNGVLRRLERIAAG